MNICIEPGCDRETRGLRCKPHNGQLIALTWARRMDEHDRQLLSDVQSGLTAQRLAVRLNRSRQWATRMIEKARRRQNLLNRQVVPDTN